MQEKASNNGNSNKEKLSNAFIDSFFLSNVTMIYHLYFVIPHIFTLSL